VDLRQQSVTLRLTHHERLHPDLGFDQMVRARSTSTGGIHGGGACGEAVRAIDWSKTSLGPQSAWSPRLVATANLVLASRHPMMLFWGPDHVQLYNDAFIPSVGPGKHPGALGLRGQECWPEAWGTLGPLLEGARRGIQGWREDHLIPIVRDGRLEDAFWTYSCSPAFEDDGSVGGALVVCTETTSRILAERRGRTLRALSSRLGAVTEPSGVTRAALEGLRDATADIPFIVAYEIDPAGTTTRLETTLPEETELLRLVDEAAEARRLLPRSNPIAIPPVPLPDARCPTPVTRVFFTAVHTESLAFGVSPRLPFDAEYQGFLEHVCETIHHVRVRVEANLARAKAESQRVELLLAAEAASRAKDEFLAMLGHELRNPLAPITTALHLMKLKEPNALVREREIIARQASHLVKLVDDLLDVARVARGKVSLNRTRVPLHDVIARAVETASPLFEQKRHVLEVDVPTKDLDVDADAIRLGQVFANLLTNAAKYTEPGGRILVHAERNDDVVVVRIEDNGVGIPPDQRPHLFDAFFQGPRAPDRAQGGLGLGLALVKSFVTLHGGSVSASSREGGGSVFEVHLQALANEEERTVETSDAIANPTAHTTDKGRVLLVDDSDDILELIASLLRHEGYEVMAAHDAPSALRVAQTFWPTVAVLDIGLPAMDGYELAQHLREALGDRAPRLIAMTGYGQEADRERARRAGFSAHLVKPVDPLELLARVRD
jgi:signal transduction histidine kinase